MTIAARHIRSLVLQLDSTEFSPEVYGQTGVYVIRSAIPSATIATWQEVWNSFYIGSLAANRQVDVYNPVVVRETLPPVLDTIHLCPPLLDIMERVYPDLALYMQRFVIKDRKSRTPVFLHHDFGYDHGWPDKTAVFVPLSPMNRDNGGLILYPGTHLFGYMGDVGELSPAVLEADWPSVCPSVEPGDIVLMHECTWHTSLPHVCGPDRVLAQVTYQPASDPSSVKLLRGRWRTEFRLGDVARADFFTRSRSTRLRELQAEVDRLRAATETDESL